MKYNFTIILMDDNKVLLENSLESLIEQEMFDKTQIIIINKMSEKNPYVEEISNEYSPNIQCYTFSGNNAEIYNKALQKSEGIFINFLDCGSTFSDYTLKNVYEYFNNNYDNTDIVSIPINYVNSDKNEEYMDYAYNKTQIIDLKKHPNYPLKILSNMFIKKESIKYQFNENINDYESLFLNQVLSLKNTIGILTNCKQITLNNYSKFILTEKIIEDKINFYNELITTTSDKNNKMPLFIHFLMTYDIQKIHKIIINNKLELMDYFNNKLINIMDHLSIKSIRENRHTDKHEKGLLMLLKNEKKSLIKTYDPHKLLQSKRDYEFTIIMAAYNTEKYIKQAIDSLLNQTLDFKKYVQLIIINDGSSDKTLDIILNYQKIYPDNIIVISQKNNGVAHARNQGLNYIKGNLVNFLDSDDLISKNTLEEVYKYYTENNDTEVLAIPMYYFEREKGRHPLNYAFRKTRVLNLRRHPNYPQTSISSTFIKYNVLKNFQFNPKLKINEDTFLVNQIILRKIRYSVLNTVRYYYRKRYDKTALKDIYFADKYYFITRLKEFHLKLIEYTLRYNKDVRWFIQYLLIYDLKYLIINPELTLDNDEDVKTFWQLFNEIIRYISPRVIQSNRNVRYYHRSFFMYFKNNKKLHTKIEDDKVQLKCGNYVMDVLNNHRIGIDSIIIRHGQLNILGHFISNFKDEVLKINLIIESNGKKQVIPAKQLFFQQENRRHVRYLSYDWIHDYNFDIYADVKDIKDAKLHIEVEYSENNHQMIYKPILLFRLTSGLKYLKNLVTENYIITIEDNIIHLQECTYLKKLYFDISDILKILWDRKEGYKYAAFLRVIYTVLYPFMKNKDIWLLNDRPTSCDDNSQHLFRYAIDQNDNITKYYVIGKDCDDYNNMKKISKNILGLRSFKHQIIGFFAKKKITSFLGLGFSHPYLESGEYDYRLFVSNRYMPNVYFIQHGVIARDTSTHIRRYNHNNVSLIVTSTEGERQSFFDIGYNYPEETVQLLGLARYDNLTSDDTKKQVVFMPTWRSFLENNETLFKNSDYYHMINNFLNNKRLEQIIKNNNYTLKLKPHPELLKHMESFSVPDYIKISTDEKYQELFRDSSMLISDFSSVVFDFAYLKKPVIYYQPKDDHQFEKAYFDYETMGFGPVIKTEEDLINQIEYYIENDCKMEDKYKQRVESSFRYNDKNNRKRIYEWILND